MLNWNCSNVFVFSIFDCHHRFKPIVKLRKDNHPMFQLSRYPLPVYLTLRSNCRSLSNLYIMKKSWWTLIIQHFSLVLRSCQSSAPSFHVQGHWMRSTWCLFSRLGLRTSSSILNMQNSYLLYLCQHTIATSASLVYFLISRTSSLSLIIWTIGNHWQETKVLVAYL